MPYVTVFMSLEYCGAELCPENVSRVLSSCSVDPLLLLLLNDCTAVPLSDRRALVYPVWGFGPCVQIELRPCIHETPGYVKDG